MKRKLCLVLGAVMLAGPLFDCSGEASGLPEDTSKTSETLAGREVEGARGGSAAGETGKKPYAETTVRVLSITGRVPDIVEAHLDDFGEETGIEVSPELYGEAQSREKITMEFLVGSFTIDAFLMNPLQDTAAYNNDEWIEPLSEYLEDPGFDWDGFSSAPMEQIRIKSDDTTRVLPLYSSVQLMFYRKGVFEGKGVKVFTSYDELSDVCDRINDPANSFYAITHRGERIALTSQFSSFFYGFGGAYFKDGMCAFNTPEDLEVARFYGKLLSDCAPEGILTAKYSQITQLFNAGQASMYVDITALYQTLIDLSESFLYDKMGAAPILRGPTGRQPYKQVAWDASIYSGSKNKEAAWEFLKHVAGRDIAADITPKGMPTFRTSVWGGGHVTAAVPEDYIQVYDKEIQADATNRYGFPRMTAVSETEDTIGKAIVYSIETKGEGADLESKMSATAEKVDQLLKDAGGYGADYPYEDQSISESNEGGL